MVCPGPVSAGHFALRAALFPAIKTLFPDCSGGSIPVPLTPMVGQCVCFLGMAWLGFLPFQGNVCVHLCLGVPGNISSLLCKYLPTSCCDDINSLIRVSIDLSFTKCFASISLMCPPTPRLVIHPVVGGLFYCYLPILQLRRLRPREVTQGHSLTESGFELE